VVFRTAPDFKADPTAVYLEVRIWDQETAFKLVHNTQDTTVVSKDISVVSNRESLVWANKDISIANKATLVADHPAVKQTLAVNNWETLAWVNKDIPAVRKNSLVAEDLGVSKALEDIITAQVVDVMGSAADVMAAEALAAGEGICCCYDQIM